MWLCGWSAAHSKQLPHAASQQSFCVPGNAELAQKVDDLDDVGCSRLRHSRITACRNLDKAEAITSYIGDVSDCVGNGWHLPVPVSGHHVHSRQNEILR